MNGVLKKIEYPTGGYVEFDWESNQMKYLGNTEYDGPQINTSYTQSEKKIR